ncbi:MAG TPA: hypothetical protein VF541_02005 [Longimicrobium sp.]
MRRFMGTITRELPAVRRQLKRAIGLGTGTAASGMAMGSLRGVVANLSPQLAVECGSRFAVIVTEPAYSLSQRYQLILPLVDATEYEQEDYDVVVIGKEWTQRVSYGLTTVLMSPKHIQAAFHPIDLASVLPAIVDENTIHEIDIALTRLFGL